MSAFYSNKVKAFIEENRNSILGSLTSKSSAAGFHQLLHSQTESWNNELSIFQNAFKEIVNNNVNALNWNILLEYPIARRAKRIDAVVLANDIIIVIEFKSGKSEYTKGDKEQLQDYCLDLRDFHLESRNKFVIPILLSTNAVDIESNIESNKAWVKDIVYSNSKNFAKLLIEVVAKWSKDGTYINASKWDQSDYSPTPTIIEAAQALYAGKSVNEISQSHAGRENLTTTSQTVINAIKLAKQQNQKIICFITGVPGAGKTLAGLNIAHESDFQLEDQSLATFLSGNGPLIKVLREALTRDAFTKIKKNNKDARKKEIERVIAFVENVHRFLDSYFISKEKIPNNKIVIFDEAQRAWNAEHSMRKFQRAASEPEMMLEIMNRHQDWAVIVALVGGGQEINTGEAGLPEWGRIIEEKYSGWKVYISPQLKVGDHSTGNLTLFETVPSNVSIVEENSLHLQVSIRSYKAEQLSNWVNLVLTNQTNEARQIFQNHLFDYEIVLTRDINKAKQWLSENCKGSRRMGLVASSGARRLRPYGLEVKNEFEDAEWFLNPRSDVRSSYYLEIPATEFGIQGLELDWVGVCWDADLRRENNNWHFKSFKGSKWLNVSKEETQKYLINKYRVLLTRASEGMVLFIPEGNKDDHTRLPSFYNPIAEYLTACGVITI